MNTALVISPLLVNIAILVIYRARLKLIKRELLTMNNIPGSAEPTSDVWPGFENNTTGGSSGHNRL